MKINVGDRLLTGKQGGFFYANKVIVIEYCDPETVNYSYEKDGGKFSRGVIDFEVAELIKLSPVTELLYE